MSKFLFLFLVQICNALDTTVDYILSDEYNDSSSAIEQEILHELHSCNNETKADFENCQSFTVISLINITAYRKPCMNPFSFAASVNANNSSRTSSYVFSPNSLYFLSTASPSLRQSLSQFPSNNRFQTVRSDKSLLSFQSYLPSCSF